MGPSLPGIWNDNPKRSKLISSSYFLLPKMIFLLMIFSYLAYVLERGLPWHLITGYHLSVGSPTSGTVEGLT